MQRTPAARAASRNAARRGTIALTSERSRPSRCMAPPSAQKSFCTSTMTSAQCSGLTFSASVFSMASSLRLEDHDADVERLDQLVAHGKLEIGLEARDVELGPV